MLLSPYHQINSTSYYICNPFVIIIAYIPGPINSILLSCRYLKYEVAIPVNLRLLLFRCNSVFFMLRYIM